MRHWHFHSIPKSQKQKNVFDWKKILFSFICVHWCLLWSGFVRFFFFNIVFPFLLNVCLSFWSVDFLNNLFTICQCELEIFILVLSDHRFDFICWSKLIMKGLKYFKLFSNYFSKRKYFDFISIFNYITVHLFYDIQMF